MKYCRLAFESLRLLYIRNLCGLTWLPASLKARTSLCNACLSSRLEWNVLKIKEESPEKIVMKFTLTWINLLLPLMGGGWERGAIGVCSRTQFSLSQDQRKLLCKQSFSSYTEHGGLCVNARVRYSQREDFALKNTEGHWHLTDLSECESWLHPVERVCRVATGQLIWIISKSLVSLVLLFIRHLSRGVAEHFVERKEEVGESLEAERTS